MKKKETLEERVKRIHAGIVKEQLHSTEFNFKLTRILQKYVDSDTAEKLMYDIENLIKKYK